MRLKICCQMFGMRRDWEILRLEYMKVCTVFFYRLSSWKSNEFLESCDYSREEIREGIRSYDAFSYGYEELAENLGGSSGDKAYVYSKDYAGSACQWNGKDIAYLRYLMALKIGRCYSLL